MLKYILITLCLWVVAMLFIIINRGLSSVDYWLPVLGVSAVCAGLSSLINDD